MSTASFPAQFGFLTGGVLHPSMRRLLLVVAVGLVLTACQGGGAPDVPEVSAAPGATHVVVDTDMGLDDALALLYLGRRDDLAIDAVVVSGTGLVHCGPGVPGG